MAKSIFGDGKNMFEKKPETALAGFVAVSGLLWTLQCTLFQPVLGKDILETVTWGSAWQLGHTKHPPLSGWIGYGIAALSGYSNFAMYLAAPLFLAVGVFYVWKLAREFFDRHEAALAALLLYTLFYYNPSSMKFCSHFVVAAFMPALVYHFVAGLKRQRLLDWLLFGLFAGLAVLGKYAALMVLFACFLYMLCDGSARKSLLRPGPWIGGAVALLLLTPHLIWLVQHDFCCLKHVGTRVSDDPVPWYYFLLVAGTALLPPVIEAVFLAAARLLTRRERLERAPVRRDALKLALYLTLVPDAIFILLSATGHDVVLMWFSFLVSWTGMIAVALYPGRITAKLYRAVWLLVVLYTAVMLVATTIDIAVKPRLRCHADPYAVARRADAFYRSARPGEPIPLVIGERWLAGVIQFYTPYHPQSNDVEDFVSREQFRKTLRTRGALLVGSRRKFEQHCPALLQGAVFVKFPISYRAPLGREDCDDFFLAVYPGEKPEAARPAPQGAPGPGRGGEGR